MSVKYIFLDIDGTLIEPRRGINSVRTEHENYFKELKRQGIKVICATGRQWNSLRSITTFEFDASICLNGAMIFIKDQLVRKNSYSKQSVRELWDTLLSLDVDFVLQGEKVYYYHKKDSSFIDEYIGRVLKQEGSKAFNGFPREDIFKASVFLSNQEQKDSLIEAVSSNHSMMFYNSPIREDSNFLNGEVTQKDIHKGKGVEFLIDYFRTSKNHAIAFGDNDNDIDMFKAVKGFAMENATNELKKYAYRVIGDVSSFTIIDEIKREINKSQNVKDKNI